MFCYIDRWLFLQLLCEKKHLFPVILDFIKHKLHHPSNADNCDTVQTVGVCYCRGSLSGSASGVDSGACSREGETAACVNWHSESGR